MSIQLLVLDVGHGNAALLHENQRTLLIDAGIRSHVLEYLKQNNITEVDSVIISHSDADHIGGLIGLLSAGLKVRSVRLNGDAQKASESWRDLIFALEDARRRGELDFNVGISTGPLEVNGFVECSLEVVSPTPELAALGVGALDRDGKKITSNSISACIRIKHQQRPLALLAGDMDDVALRNALSADADLQADLLVFPHHGGLPGSSDATDFTNTLLRKVAPSTVIFSIGRNKHDNPRPEIVSSVAASGAYIACTQLSKRCSESPIPGGARHTLHSAGAVTSSCCAGSIKVQISDAEERYTWVKDHSSFVAKIPTAICRPSANPEPRVSR